MQAKNFVERAEPWMRMTAALLGTFLVALPATICVARFFPAAADMRLAVALGGAIPVWVGLMCVVFAARSGYLAWAVCLGFGAVLGGVAWVV